MNKILVPVDFTKNSFAAFYYAHKLAAKTDGVVTLMHVINGSFTTSDSLFLDSLESAGKAAKMRLKYFAKEYPLELGIEMEKVKFKYEVRFGVPGFTVVDYLKDVYFDCVVMGTRDKHNIIERFFGTTSSIIARLSSRPVLLIHENTKYHEIKKVVFAIDNHLDFDESVDEYIAFNEYFGASTDFVHVAEENVKIDETKNEVVKEIFENKEPDFAFQIKNIQANDPIQGLIDYCINEKTDMLVLVHRRKSLLGEIFTSSFSLTTSEGLHLPIMILNETFIEEE
ncbi:MAG: universal stress protein [Saprospiraceae bacterium]|nr:universal stress protein [Saprospiraceae bacterium]